MHFSCWGSRPGSSIRPTRCRRRVFPEDELELFHVDVHPFFELFGGRKNTVRMVSSAPFDSGGLDVEMRDLPPAADFEADASARLEQLLVAGVSASYCSRKVPGKSYRFISSSCLTTVSCSTVCVILALRGSSSLMKLTMLMIRGVSLFAASKPSGNPLSAEQEACFFHGL